MSDRLLMVISSGIGLVGVIISAYLVRVRFDLDAFVCGTGDCELVQSSTYATICVIPIATFGGAMYASLLALGILRLRAPRFFGSASTAALGLSLAGSLYSAWLTWLELYEIEAICQWCVVSATLTLLLFGIEIIVLVRLWKA